ncbi:hypothetical protein [Maribellus maritimus]|uniref:hypothetical protein n=1 Tax=Maribellus maritimus TaxID=2870838 RepID=UPI001EEB4168|nr:hypothetical protein [Maribellus maritimus]MCG6190072.1 hypothetical protein [Maribellus maritimus]
MSKKTLIWICVIWIIITLLNYYIVPYFILAFEWIFMTVFLLIMTIIQIVKLIKERHQIKKQRFYSLLVITSLFILTFYRDVPNRTIEKIDWIILLNKRVKIVEQVKNNTLKPGKGKSGQICELPFEFPIVSNGGNDIVFYKNRTDSTLTVKFWVFRNFFDSPSTYFVYTEDSEEKKQIENLIEKHPKSNWKIKDNWYRVYRIGF